MTDKEFFLDACDNRTSTWGHIDRGAAKITTIEDANRFVRGFAAVHGSELVSSFSARVRSELVKLAAEHNGHAPTAEPEPVVIVRDGPLYADFDPVAGF